MKTWRITYRFKQSSNRFEAFVYTDDKGTKEDAKKLFRSMIHTNHTVDLRTIRVMPDPFY